MLVNNAGVLVGYDGVAKVRMEDYDKSMEVRGTEWSWERGSESLCLVCPRRST